MNYHSNATELLSSINFNRELAYYDKLHHEKYRDSNQTKVQHAQQLAFKLATNSGHHKKILSSLLQDRFLPAGRIQAALGATEREVSPFNCSVSQTIEDSLVSIFDGVKAAALILQKGTGIGYNFSHLRPKGALIRSVQTESSGPLSFMRVFDAMAATISSSGHRRGAQMGILNVDHPDIEAFVDAKMEAGAYRQFNLSVGITDDFMGAVETNKEWPLVHGGIVYKTVLARYLWEKITRNAYNSAEPGIIFIDRLNDQNNLHYCETIEATNPCAEQPLPPYGLCTLGSFNLVGYVHHADDGRPYFDYNTFISDIHAWVRAYDNIFDTSIYAIPEHREEAISKRRIGLGFTGIANAIEYLCGEPNYGEPGFLFHLDKMCRTLRDHAYAASIDLARERGAFKLYDPRYLESKFVASLPDRIKADIREHGIRNSHLISYAPCGTISQCALNVSSGVEPVFHHEVSRDVYMKEGKVNVTLKDYNWRQYGFVGKTLEECSVSDHMSVAQTIQRYCDSSISKTVNVASSCSYEDYAQIYIQAHQLGLKGITVYRPSDLRGIVIKAAEKTDEKPMLIPTSCVNGTCSM